MTTVEVFPGNDVGKSDPIFHQPILILSPPRSGSTLLFELLAESPSVFTVGGESHHVVERVTGLSPRDRGYDSNVLDAADATSERVQELRAHFHGALRDRNGTRPPPGPVRMLEKTPKNALRTSFFNAVFPESRFIFLYRDARETIASMIDAWQSGRFHTYPGLPGWTFPMPWSLLLVPGWRDLVRKPLHEIVIAQWTITMNALLDGLDGVSEERWCAVDYADLARDPQSTARELCEKFDLRWDRVIDGGFRYSRYTLTPPAPEKWRRHASVIEPLYPMLEPTIERARHALERGRTRRK